MERGGVLKYLFVVLALAHITAAAIVTVDDIFSSNYITIQMSEVEVATTFLPLSQCGYPNGDVVLSLLTRSYFEDSGTVMYVGLGMKNESKFAPNPDPLHYDYVNCKDYECFESITVPSATASDIYITIMCNGTDYCDFALRATTGSASSKQTRSYQVGKGPALLLPKGDIKQTSLQLYAGWEQTYSSASYSKYGPEYKLETCPSLLSALWGDGQTMCLQIQITATALTDLYNQYVSESSTQSSTVPHWNQRPVNYDNPSGDLSGVSKLAYSVLLSKPVLPADAPKVLYSSVQFWGGTASSNYYMTYMWVRCNA